ncbi:hypothetical protein Trydic_g15745 [Trypoxylus dichotomus]
MYDFGREGAIIGAPRVREMTGNRDEPFGEGFARYSEEENKCYGYFSDREMIISERARWALPLLIEINFRKIASSQ